MLLFLFLFVVFFLCRMVNKIGISKSHTEFFALPLPLSLSFSTCPTLPSHLPLSLRVPVYYLSSLASIFPLPLPSLLLSTCQSFLHTFPYPFLYLSINSYLLWPLPFLYRACFAPLKLPLPSAPRYTHYWSEQARNTTVTHTFGTQATFSRSLRPSPA